MNKSIPHIIEFPKTGNQQQGHLSFIENSGQLPFTIQRLYWVYGNDTATIRGNHAHASSDQIFICMNGSIDIELEDSNSKIHQYTLNTPDKGLFIPGLCWRKFNFSTDSICLCISSSIYSDEVYIKNYEEFKAKIATIKI